MSDNMTALQYVYLMSMLNEMRQRAYKATQVIQFSGSEMLRLPPTPENDLQAYVVRGFWQRATISPAMRQEEALMLIRMFQGYEEPMLFIEMLTKRGRTDWLGTDANIFLLSYSKSLPFAM